MRVIQIAYLLGLLAFAASGCHGQVDLAGRWDQVTSDVLSVDIPEGWKGRLKWDRPHGFLFEIQTRDFREIDITSAAAGKSGLFVSGGTRILLLGLWQDEQPTEDLLRSKAKAEVHSLPDVGVAELALARGKCWFARWKYGSGQEETAMWCGFYSSMENRDVLKISMTYSADGLKDDEVQQLMKRLLMSIRYATKGENK